MAVAYGAVSQPGLLPQQYPPPLLPKPGKDNVRLQKLLKRTAKKKASAQTSQSAAPFRSSLSPVNEASPDLEHSDHSTPPQTPVGASGFYGVQQPSRYSVRPLYQHVASPYPQRAAYGRGARFSPQTVATPSYLHSQNVTAVTSYSAVTHISGVLPDQGPVVQTVVPKISLSVSPVPETTAPSAVKRQKPASSGPTPYPGPTYPAAGQSVTRPLIVLTPFIKPKSPRPTFKATEPSRSPKPMFDVPQIRMYTATTSFYEISRTPPVYDTSGLISIGITIPQSKIATEIKQDLPLAKDIRKGTPLAQSPLLGTDAQRKTPDIKRTTPTADIKRTTPTADIKRTTPTADIKRTTPTPDIKRTTPTAEIKRTTPTPDIKRTTPTTDIKRTPTAEIKRTTPTPDIKRTTPTTEVKKMTPTPEIKRTTPTPEIRDKTPTFQISRTSAGRPRTPAYHVTRATTPVVEISKPNPLLFAVSPVTTDPDRSKTKPEITPNGDIQSDLTPTAKPLQQQNVTMAKSEPDEETREKIPVAEVGSERPKSQTLEPSTPAKTSCGYQRPMTPTYEATRLMTTSPGYKRPKTPTGVSPVAFQRPKTPTQVAKSGYRGLTPAEYAAYGGIKTYSPAFGISCSKTSHVENIKLTEESVECKTFSQQPSVESPTAQASKVKETPKDVKDESSSTISSIPVIVVSQASDTSGITLPQETSMASSQAAVREEIVVQETPKAEPQTAGVKTSVNQNTETSVPEITKPKTQIPEAKHTPPHGPEQDPLKAVRKLLGKAKPQTAEQNATAEIKPDVSKQNEPQKPVAATETKAEDSKPSSAVPGEVPAVQPAGHEAKGKDVLQKKEGDKSPPKAESLLKVLQQPKEVKSKKSGWSRLKKHMVVEQEEPKFPDSETGSAKEATGQDQSKAIKADEKPDSQDETQTKDTAKATKMWDAVLFQMFSTKENIMYQIELNKSEEDKNMDEAKEIPSFAYRLPVLLFSPKFDAKKLREAALRPATKISTVFEMGLIGRKSKDEEPKDFNRTARGFAVS